MLDLPVLPTFDLAVSPPPTAYKPTLPTLFLTPPPLSLRHYHFKALDLLNHEKIQALVQSLSDKDDGIKSPLLLNLQLQLIMVGRGDEQGWAFFMSMRFYPGLLEPYHNILVPCVLLGLASSLGHSTFVVFQATVFVHVWCCIWLFRCCWLCGGGVGLPCTGIVDMRRGWLVVVTGDAG